MEKIFFLLILYLYSYNTYAQEGCSQLVWSNEYQLQWLDFMGVPDSTILLYGDIPDAISAIYIEVEIDSSNNYRAVAKFDQCKSWVRIETDEILIHERGHFNITELLARELQVILDQNQDNYEMNINNVYNEMILKCEEMHRLYDSETLFGTIKEKQKAWSVSLLNKLGCND